MSRWRIGQERFGIAVDRGQHSSLDVLARLIDWVPIDHAIGPVSCAAKGGPAWPPTALFKAMLLSIWYDLSDVKIQQFAERLMPGPNLTENGKMVKAPLLTFERFIEMGRSCTVKPPIDNASLGNSA